MHSGIEREPGTNVSAGPWFKEWFATDYYLKLYVHRDDREAEACIDLIVNTIGLPKPGTAPRALDLACGPGRHAIALARRGFDVTAVDLSPTLIGYAGESAEEAGVTIRFEQSDMRAIDHRDEFDLAVQLFTSFGYFDSTADDAMVLSRVRQALHVGGWYALDLINRNRLRETLVTRSEKELEGMKIVERRQIEGDRVIKEISIDGDDGEHHYMESVRLFTPELIDGMLREARIEPQQWFGDYHGAPYDVDRSDRMLVICRAV